MFRIEFIIVIVIVFFIVFSFGWFVNWLVYCFICVVQFDVDELECMSQELYEVEEICDQVIIYLQQCEVEFINQFSQIEVEFVVVMEGLWDVWVQLGQVISV